MVSSPIGITLKLNWIQLNKYFYAKYIIFILNGKFIKKYKIRANLEFIGTNNLIIIKIKEVGV